MEEKAILTVFIITYNHVDSIARAIDSVLEQKTDYKFAIKILDDASNDGTTDIVRKYAEKYKDLIVPVIQEKNTGGAQGQLRYEKLLDTKYYATLEGDDYWCDPEKLQLQIDALENNPNCSYCAHNTLVKFVETGTERLYVEGRDGLYTFPPPKLKKEFYIEPHTSSRVYRSSCVEWDKVKDKIVVNYDIAASFYFLTKGDLYYIDRVMSVYNFTGKGIYTSTTPHSQKYKSAEVINRLNKELGYKYDYLLGKYFLNRLHCSLLTYIRWKFFTPKENLEKFYSSLLYKFQYKYLSKRDVNPILKLMLPVGKGKWVALEIKKEKK